MVCVNKRRDIEYRVKKDSAKGNDKYKIKE